MVLRVDNMDDHSISQSVDVLDSPAYLSLIDLITDIWDESCPATLNIKILIAVISEYTVKRALEDAQFKGLNMMKLLRDMNDMLQTKMPNDAACVKREMQRFLHCHITKDLHNQMVKGVMTDVMYNELLNDYHNYVVQMRQHLVRDVASTIDIETGEEDENEKRTAASSLDVEMDEDENRQCEDEDIQSEDDNEKRTEGIDALFESMARQAKGLIAQNVTKVENGRVYVMRTPGEIDRSVVRVSVYDFNEVKNRDKRDWWKYSNLRAQFLFSPLIKDRRSRAVRDLFDVAANHLTTVSGVVKEVRDQFRIDLGDRFYEDGKRKRSDDEPLVEGESDNAAANAYVGEFACSIIHDDD